MSTKATATMNFSWLGLLGIIFVLCKVFEFGPIATWSWWLVLLPFYIGLAIIMVIAILIGLGYLGVLGLESLENHKRRQRFNKEKNNG